MNKDEWQDEIRRRDDIIESYKGIECDFLFIDAKLSAIKYIIESKATAAERVKMVSALLDA